jgi:NAD-dependent dihydropyrimidine dehydrogenase PreA subunit
MSKLDNCPACNVSWIGELIPVEFNHAPGTHWRREIGIDGGYAGIYDGTVALRCPDCAHECPVNSSTWAKELYDKYITYMIKESK